VVSTDALVEENALTFPQDPSRFILLPVNARRRYGEVLAAQDGLEREAVDSRFNSYQPGNRKGVIVCGIAYNYLNENFGGGCDRTVLKISQYPIPRELVRRMTTGCDEILVLEDGQPFVEEALRGLLDCTGKIRGRLSGEVPRMGELNPDNVRAALGLDGGNGLSDLKDDAKTAAVSKNVVPRPPALCAGCGHRDVYGALTAIVKEYPNAKVFSDIGCYTLGALPPFRAIDSCLDMGASITMAKGAADGGLFPSIAVIGDSTFTHSGITGLLDAVNSRSSVTIIISDNLTTAMTGGQDSAGTGRLEAICRGVGVEPEHLHVVTPLPKNMESIKELMRQEIEYRGVSVIIPRRECIQTLKRKAKK
jgi:indolepyruvate ferredoxin oxidoreductase alpha subunit